MADNVDTKTASNIPVATDVVTYSGDSGQNVQLVRSVTVTGAEGAKTVVDLPGDASYGRDVDVTRMPPAMVDTFGKLQVVNCINDIDVQFFRDVPENLVTVSASGGGTASTVSALMQLASSTGTTGSVTATSREKTLYRSGGEIYALFTVAFVDGGVANCNQTIGLTDGTNGFYIGFTGTTFNLYSITGGTPTTIASASWTGDKLDASATSRFTRGGTPEAIDHTKLNLWRIRFGWLGAAPIKFEVCSPDGEWILVHTIRQPNLSATPSIASADLPIRADVTKTSGATNVRLNTACWGAGCTYDKVDIVGSNTLSSVANSTVVYNTQGVGTLQIRIGTGTTGTIAFEATVDGTSWVQHPSCFLMGAAGSSDTQVTVAVTPASGNIYRMQCAGFRAVRARTATTLGANAVLVVQGDSSATMMNLVGGVVGNAAHDAVDSNPPVKIGFKAETSTAGVTLVADGDRTDGYADADGIQLVKPFAPNADILVERLSNTDGNSTASTVFGATANARNCITTIAVFNDSTTNGFIDFRDGTAGTVLFTLPLPAKGGAVCNFPLPLRQTTVNTAFAYDVSAALTTVYISLIGFKSKA